MSDIQNDYDRIAFSIEDGLRVLTGNSHEPHHGSLRPVLEIHTGAAGHRRKTHEKHKTILKNLKVALEEVAKLAATLKQERDELREEVASLRLEAKYHDEADALRKLRERERDEAREALRTLAEHGESEIQRLTKERDEAREALEYIAHSGLSARFLEDFAREFLRRKETAK